MAAKKETKIIERTYNVPLRKEYRKVPRWKRTKKAVKALKEFLQKHMKSEDVKLSTDLNQEMWKHGIRNPPHHVKVTVSKNDKGEVNADLFGKKEKVVRKKKVVKK
jgi:large subunit ribosomal protein L31e